jgi:hypothetical protein
MKFQVGDVVTINKKYASMRDGCFAGKIGRIVVSPYMNYDCAVEFEGVSTSFQCEGKKYFGYIFYEKELDAARSYKELL